MGFVAALMEGQHLPRADVPPRRSIPRIVTNFSLIRANSTAEAKKCADPARSVIPASL